MTPTNLTGFIGLGKVKARKAELEAELTSINNLLALATSYGQTLKEVAWAPPPASPAPAHLHPAATTYRPHGYKRGNYAQR